MIPQPSIKANELIEKANSYLQTGQFTELDLKRLKNDAEKIKHIDVSLAFSILGMIACLEGNIPAMHEYFNRALLLSGDGTFEMRQYAKSLLFLSLFDDAYQPSMKAYQRNPRDINNLNILIQSTGAIGQIEEFKQYAAQWRKITGADHEMLRSPLITRRHDIKAIAEFIEKHPETNEILLESNTGITRIFTPPTVVILELMPNSNHELVMIAWIRCFDDIEDGMEKYFRFEEWYIDQELDLKSDDIHFNIEFAG